MNSQNSLLKKTLAEQYPFLAYWKKRGFEQFPVPPPDFLIEQERKFFKEAGLPIGNGLLSTVIVRDHLRDKEQLWLSTQGSKIEEILDEYKYGKLTWREAAQRLSNIFLPSSKGGPAIPFEEERRALKWIYTKEFMGTEGCLQKIRHSVGVTSTHIREGGLSVAEEKEMVIDEINETFRDILSIFDEKEIQLIFKYSRRRECALEMMYNRLKRLFHAPLNDPRGLKKILDRTPLPNWS
jgi:hypothetical protein